MTSRRKWFGWTLAALAALPRHAAAQDDAGEGSAVRELHRQPLLSDTGGREAIFLEVTLEPGGPSRPHVHGGIVLGYVLEGRFRFAIGDDDARVVEEGQAFFEPSGAVHRVSEAVDGKRVRLLAIILLEPGKQVVTPA